MLMHRLTAASILCVFSLTGCVYEYKATAKCRGCQGDYEVIGGWECSQSAAVENAAIGCLDDAWTGSEVESRLVFSWLSDCAGSLTLSPAAVVDNAIDRAIRAASRKTPARAEAADTACTTNLKVTVFQDVPVTECPGDIRVEVNYSKKISDNEFEPVTLSATIPVSGSHEFLCTNPALAADGKLNTIRVAVYSDLNCLGETVLAIGKAYSEIPADGSSLVCRADLVNLQITDEIIPPAAPVAAPRAARDAARPKLIPIPDPMFRRDR